LRRSLELNHDGSRDSIPPLEEALARLLIRLEWDGDRSRLEPVESGVTGALTRIAVAMYQAVADGTWWRLKICSDDECEWAYYDASKNRARNWCEYGCGNRAKVRAYRERRRASAG
jgi:predicted RNA-binding Zn ribbon-like protein